MNTSTLSLLISEMVSSPHRWKETGNKSIYNGYYTVSLDGSVFGMGMAAYTSDPSERDMLVKAVDEWKLATGWGASVQPKEETEEVERPVYNDNAHQIFAKAVRSAQAAYMMHQSGGALADLIQRAIMDLDEALSVQNRHKKRTK